MPTMLIAQEIRDNIDINSADGVITLDYEGRFLRRKRLTTDSGEAFLVELQKQCPCHQRTVLC